MYDVDDFGGEQILVLRSRLSSHGLSPSRVRVRQFSTTKLSNHPHPFVNPRANVRHTQTRSNPTGPFSARIIITVNGVL